MSYEEQKHTALAYPSIEDLREDFIVTWFPDRIVMHKLDRLPLLTNERRGLLSWNMRV